MRKSAFLAIFCLAATLQSGSDLMAFTYEVHPGIYDSYEYSDNYRGSVGNQYSESIYRIGPSLQLSCISPSLNLDLRGRYAKSFHNRYPEEETPEINITSLASYITPRQTARLSYEFVRTLTRENLSDPFSEVKRNSGAITYNLALNQQNSMDAGCSISRDVWNTPEYPGVAPPPQDETSIGVNTGFTTLLDQWNTLGFSIRRDYYRYDRIPASATQDPDAAALNPDAISNNFRVNLTHVLSPSLNIGVVAAYNHVYKDKVPVSSDGTETDTSDRSANEDRYDVSLTSNYAISQSTTTNLTGGYTWLIMQRLSDQPIDQSNHQSTYTMNASIERNIGDDRVHLGLSKAYSAEFTGNRYGTYDTKAAAFRWDRQWLQAWSTSTNISITKRKPSTDIAGQETKDSSGSLSLNWRPIEYFSANLRYEHLITRFYTSEVNPTPGTARENRYRFMIEVQY